MKLILEKPYRNTDHSQKEKTMRKDLFLFFVVALAFTAFLISSEAIAFYDNSEPEGDLPISTTTGKYKITLVEINKIAESEYKWTYNITRNGNKPTGLNFLAMLIPDCRGIQSDPKIIIREDPDSGVSFGGSLQQFAVAEGETVVNFGQFIEQGFVIKGTSDDNIEWSFIANTNAMTKITALVKYQGREVSGEIPGPGCTLNENCPVPKVRVEPRVQCFQFVAETDECSTDQTWYAEWDGSDPCAVDVWAAQGIVACNQMKNDGLKLQGEELGDIKLVFEDGSQTIEQPLTEAINNNSQCSEGWLRFTDPTTGCNKRCYYSGGKRYCF
jgi:hypothetical protein